MVLTYAGIPNQITAPVIGVIAGGLTTAVSGSLYWQLRNRQGFNLYSQPTTINLTASQGLAVTVPNCNCEGYEPIEYILSFSPTNTYLSAFVIATYASDLPLPGTINLTKDEHFKTQLSVGTVAQLPTDKINGMRVYVDAWAEIREWKSNAWVKVYPQTFNTLISSTKSVNGCDRPLDQFNDEDKKIVIYPEYSLDRSYSPAVKYWIRNETTTDFFAGRSVIINISCNGNDVTELFLGAGAINLTFIGYVNLTDGTLDTTASNGGQMSGINQRFTYSKNDTGLILEKDLEPNFAYMVAVEIQTDIGSLNDRIPNNSVIEINLLIGDRTGYYSGVADIIGNLITAELDKRRIVPDVGLSAIALSGSGIVKGRSFIGVGERNVLGLIANTANQLIAINGNGTCLAVSSLSSGQVLRAKIGTLNGIGKTVDLGEISLAPNKQIQINLDYSNTVRDDYPDIIKGNTKGKFNASQVWVWLGNQKFTFLIDNGVSSQTLTITTPIGETDNTPQVITELGLFKPVVSSFLAVNGVSSFTYANYEVKLAYYYENTVTSISHTDAIAELETDLLSYIALAARTEAEIVARKYAIIFG